VVAAVDGADPGVEDPNEVARAALARARQGTASRLWVAATAGLERLPPEVVEAKLAALAEGVRQARLWLAKEQFDHDDPGPSWGPRGYAG
jgi:methionine synthase II (cobalamin-independent)